MQQILPLAALGQDGKGPMSVRMTIKGADGSADAHHDKADAHHDKADAHHDKVTVTMTRLTLTMTRGRSPWQRATKDDKGCYWAGSCSTPVS